MPVKRPYYGLHQIISGKYTAGNEYVLDNGDEYVGAYHVLPNSQLFTHAQPTIHSKQLFEKRNDISESVKVYNRIKKIDIGKYLSPMPYQPRPTADDYKRGKIQRYFVQKRNSPENTNVEIDADQYNTINVDNNPGINGIIWKGASITWYISQISKDETIVLNARAADKINNILNSIKKYLTNYLEMYK